MSSSDTFDAAYARLNPAQRQAVDTIEGPVMVVAGPGTGKTQVLSLRVANILRRTQVGPRSILCLTFSSSGATAMRERLRSLIGAQAYGVTINTIHGFCNDIILQHPHVFEAFNSLEQISDVEQVRAVNRIIDSLLPDCVLVNRKYPYGRTKDILSRISQVKKEGKTVDDLQRAADDYEVAMHGKSKEGTKAHEKNVLAAKKFRAFVTVFAAYQQMLEDTGRYDYDDMILNVLRALKEEDWLLAELQERYLYVLVDEFQDTNGAQFRVIERLITGPLPEDNPNIFVVGDDDQAIYRFQGANLQNILSFRSRFPTAPVITLTVSYRCYQHVLDAAGALIANNTERLVGRIDGITKDLTSGAEEEGVPPELLRCPSDIVEPWMIADVIEDELRAGTPPPHVAVLTQTNAELRPIYDVLKARGIPVQMDGKVNLLEHPLVRQVVSILRHLGHPEEDALLSAALACECFRSHPADLGRLFLRSRDDDALTGILLSLDDPSSDAAKEPWHDLPSLLHARDCLFSLRQQLANRTLVDTLEHLYRECGLLPPAAKDGGMSELFDPLDFAALQAFFEFVKMRCYEQITYDFTALLHDLELYLHAEYGLRLSFTLPHLTQEGVQLLTAHQSKGLEFDVVILPNFRDGHWDKRRNPSSLAMPEDLLFGWNGDQKKFEQHQDERRVAFVAMTRARRRLVFTCPLQITSGVKPRDVSPSGFFVESGELPETQQSVNSPEQMSTLILAPPLLLDEAFRAFLHERLREYRLSVTALNHFLEDPLKFLEEDLLRKPRAKERSLVYGNAVHAALKKWGMSVQKGTPLDAEGFLSEFRNYLVDYEILTEADRRDLLAEGAALLPRYHEQRLAAQSPFVFRVEMPLSVYLPSVDGGENGVPLKGMIDRIDLAHADSRHALLIDYKTGRPKTESQIRDEADYFRQLVFYSLLMEHGLPLYEPTAFILDFIGQGTDHPVERRFTVSAHEKQELKRVVEAVWSKIKRLDFTPVT